MELLRTLDSTGRRFYLQAEVDDVGNVRSDDGHFDLHELNKNLHGFRGLVLHTHRPESTRTGPQRKSETFTSRLYLISTDEAFKSEDQVWDDVSHQLLKNKPEENQKTTFR